MPEWTGIYKVSSHERQVVGALGSIGGATLASRILGFVRDAVVAQVFGAGPVTDAFFVAFRIPNILRRLLAEGALSTAVIPVFTDYAMTRSARRAAPDAAGGARGGADRPGPHERARGRWPLRGS